MNPWSYSDRTRGQFIWVAIRTLEVEIWVMKGVKEGFGGKEVLELVSDYGWNP